MENIQKQFRVKGLGPNGEKVSEIVSAATEIEASRQVSSDGTFVTSIELMTAQHAERTKKIKTKDLIMFSHQTSAMLEAGISTDKALNLVRQKTESKRTKEVFGKIYEEVQKGQSVSGALDSTKAFPTLYVNMVRSGETSGDIGKTLRTLSTFYEKEAEMKRSIKSAMIYPIILSILTVLITTALLVFVLPGITESFTAEEMPWLTATLMKISDFMIDKWYIVLGVIVAIVLGIRELFRIDKFKIEFDSFRLRMPVVGKILRTIYSSRAANTIASLYAVGSSMLTIVSETGGTIGNRYIETLFNDIYIKVSTGEFLSKAMEETKVFDPMLTSMIEIGEEAGDLEDILQKMSRFFDSESTAATKQLVSLLEPVMLIIMGLVVGVIVVAIMLPMMNMGNVV